jgi:hypothetical protein
METAGPTSAGELLLRSDEVERATLEIAAEVHAHLSTAMQGPFGVAGAQAFSATAAQAVGTPAPAGDWSGRTTQAMPNAHDDGSAGLTGAHLLAGRATEVLPQRFIGAGVALTVAYSALGEADGVRVAAGLRCAAAALFPNDDDGWVQVERAAAASIGHLEPIADPDVGDPATQTMAMQRRVYAAAESLNRAYLAASTRLQVASLGSASWRAVSGGIGPGSDAVATAFGPFLHGLVRFAFFTAVAVHFVRRDDWAWVGAALIGARLDVHRGADGMHGITSPA